MHSKKMIDIYFDAGFEDIILEKLKEEGINEYYKFPKVLGKTLQSEPKLDEHIWPGYFILIKFIIDESQVKGVLNELKKAGELYRDKGFEIYITDTYSVF